MLKRRPVGTADTVIADMEDNFMRIFLRCKPYTMTSIERMYALYTGTRYIIDAGVPGDIVECGFWRGGSSMLCALTLLEVGEHRRKIYMYDTYAGMSRPSHKDVDYLGRSACEIWEAKNYDGENEWAFAPLDEVKANMEATGYSEENMIYVKGKVEDTIPKVLPGKIALLRLDTDWYESTHNELVHLFPLLEPGGVLILDDYGHHKGAREAVDGYFRDNSIRMLLNRIDYTGRIGVKS